MCALAREGISASVLVVLVARVESVPGVVGVMAFDPGVTTGVAWGMFDLSVRGGVGDVLRAGVRTGSCEVDCGGGAGRDGERAGAESVALLWARLDFEWTLAGLGAGERWLVYEDFVLRARVGSLGVEGLAPVRVTGLVLGMLVRRVGEDRIVAQMAGDAKGFATGARLRKWGRWVVGSEHQRDAWRHLSLWLARNR